MLLYTDRIYVQKKKSKKKRSRSEDNAPDAQLQDSVESSTVLYSAEHHNVSKTDKKHVLSTAKLTDAQKSANGKRNRTHSETVCTTDSCEDVAASKVEGQCLNSEKKNVGNLGQMGQQSLSGIKPAVDLHGHTHTQTVLTAIFPGGFYGFALNFSFSFSYILLPLWTLCWLKHACMHACLLWLQSGGILLSL